MTMWNRFNNLFASLQTHGDLSPDLNLRWQVNRELRQRPTLTLDSWFASFYRPHGVSYAIASFAYERLADYSGLEFGRVLPEDRLDEDLYWAQICWFDWDLQLYNDFSQQFGVDISDCFDVATLSTVQDLIILLNSYVES